MTQRTLTTEEIGTLGAIAASFPAGSSKQRAILTVLGLHTPPPAPDPLVERAREVARDYTNRFLRREIGTFEETLLAAIHELTKGPTCGSSGDGYGVQSPDAATPSSATTSTPGTTSTTDAAPAADAASELLSAREFAELFAGNNYGDIYADTLAATLQRDAATIAWIRQMGFWDPAYYRLADCLERHLKGGGA